MPGVSLPRRLSQRPLAPAVAPADPHLRASGLDSAWMAKLVDRARRDGREVQRQATIRRDRRGGRGEPERPAEISPSRIDYRISRTRSVSPASFLCLDHACQCSIAICSITTLHRFVSTTTIQRSRLSGVRLVAPRVLRHGRLRRFSSPVLRTAELSVGSALGGLGYRAGVDSRAAGMQRLVGHVHAHVREHVTWSSSREARR
jgi:hypothetical protein